MYLFPLYAGRRFCMADWLRKPLCTRAESQVESARGFVRFVSVVLLGRQVEHLEYRGGFSSDGEVKLRLCRSNTLLRHLYTAINIRSKACQTVLKNMNTSKSSLSGYLQQNIRGKCVETFS